MGSKNIHLNIVFNVISFAITFIISFFLSPFLVKKLGIEAYGFVSLANNIISYFSLATIALNSMAGRFVTISIHKNNIDEANKYFNSVLFSNVIFTTILFLPALLTVVFSNKWFAIPEYLQKDVIILLVFIFASFFINIYVNVFSIALYVKNKIYLSSIRIMEASIIRLALTLILFGFFPAKIFYISIINVITTLYIAGWNIFYTKKLLPNIYISKKQFDIKYVQELLASGVWNLLSKIGVTFLEGLDLIIANKFLGVTEMGVLSVAKLVPGMIKSFIFTIAAAFSPNLTKLYAMNRPDELKDILIQSIKLLGMVSNIPIVILFVFGDNFFRLWMPTQDSNLLQILSILTIISFVVNGSIAAIYEGFTIANKVKPQSIVIIISGILNTLVVLYLLKTTNYGLYAIAGVSTLITLIRDLFYGLPFACKYLNFKWCTFYPQVALNILTFLVNVILGILLKRFLFIENWIQLVSSCILLAFLVVIINLFFVFSKEERKAICSVIRDKSKKWRLNI